MSDSRLPRSLGFLSTTAVLIGITIGSGIFRSPAGVADRLPGPLPLLAVWGVGGLVVLCGALTLAEIAGVFPRTGGLYVYLREGWGTLPAFLFGWAELVVIRAAAVGAISTTFAEYLLRVLGYDPAVPPYDWYVHLIAAAAIAITGTFNVVGLRWGSLVQNITTVAKYAGLLAIVLLAAALALPRTGGHYTPAAPPGSFSASSFGLALVGVLWAYDGWEDVSFVGGEVKDAHRALPRAIIAGTVAVIVIYLLTNLAYLAVLPVEEMRHSPLVAADVASRLIGAPGVILISSMVMLSAFGSLNGSMLASPRIFFAMADDGLLLRPVAAVHPRFRTPYVAIVLTAVLGIVFVLVRNFQQLADAFVIAIVPFLALSVAAVFTLRRRPDYAPSIRVPGYPVVPLVFIVATVFLLLNAILEPASRWPTLLVLGIVVLGIPVFYLTVGRRRAARTGRTVTESLPARNIPDA